MTECLPKLVALDLDGTLLTNQGTLSARNRAALDKLASLGVKLVVCTGRPPRLVNDLLSHLPAGTQLITFNGAALVSDRVQYRHHLPCELVHDVIRTVTRAFSDIMVGLEASHGHYVDSHLAAYRSARGLPHGAVAASADMADVIADYVIKVFFRHPELTAQHLAQALTDTPVYATWSSAGLLEVLAHAVNKREALEFLTLQLGIDPAEVAAFGDARNDLEMLSWAGLGVAMANATEDVKAAAKLITASNDDDGVAQVIEGWL